MIHTNDINHLEPLLPNDFVIVVTYGYPRSYEQCRAARKRLTIAQRYANVVMSAIYKRSGVAADEIHYQEIKWLAQQFNDNCMLFSYRQVTR